MEEHYELPGLIDILKGEAGERQRIILTLALCFIIALLVVGLNADILIIMRRRHCSKDGLTDNR